MEVADLSAAQRKKRVVAPTLSGVGISVPFDRKTEVGYREPSCQPYPTALVQIVRRMQAQAVRRAAAAAPSLQQCGALQHGTPRCSEVAGCNRTAARASTARSSTRSCYG